ncbi:MAG: hypothetical protein Q4A65_08055 [Bacillota bacterium]|nr:hypothetical protein [Bacillota bacterium]
MKYFLQEIAEDGQKLNKNGKVRRDFEAVLKSMGFVEVAIPQAPSVNLGAYRNIRDNFEFFREGDVLIVQLPLTTSAAILRRLFKSLSRRGVRTFLVVRDLDIILEGNKSYWKHCEGVIVQNEKTAMELIKQKVDVDKIIPLDLTDYLIPDSISGSCGEYGLKEPVIISGKLTREEAGYIYRLPDNCRFRLYGQKYEGQIDDHILAGGSYDPDDLPFMLKGSFGLVWDGPTPMTCLGIAGEKMKISDPYQLSLYLASGLPVIVWSESAIADFVIQKGCGFTVSSLVEIGYRIKSMSEKTYKNMRRNAEDIGIPLRDGCYIRVAMNKILK